MEKLIKPIEYAQKMGISRQAVYAKIKKGLLPSKTIGGKIYIVIEDEKKSISDNNSEESENIDSLLNAKDETISVLKETIKDLKETNQMITSTLRSEVELLKEAFNEMKTLYSAQIEHIKREDEAELIEYMEDDTEDTILEDKKEKKIEEEWLLLDNVLNELPKKKIRKKFIKLLEDAHKKGKKGIKEEAGEIFINPDRLEKLLAKIN